MLKQARKSKILLIISKECLLLRFINTAEGHHLNLFRVKCIWEVFLSSVVC